MRVSLPRNLHWGTVSALCDHPTCLTLVQEKVQDACRRGWYVEVPRQIPGQFLPGTSPQCPFICQLAINMMQNPRDLNAIRCDQCEKCVCAYYVCTCVCTWVYMCAYMLWGIHACVCRYVCINLYTHIYVYTYICIHMCTHVCTCVYAWVCICR